MDDDEYPGMYPWYLEIRSDLGLLCLRCNRYYQGEDEWRQALAHDPRRWDTVVANAARAQGWRRLKKGGFLCPKCVRRREQARERKDSHE